MDSVANTHQFLCSFLEIDSSRAILAPAAFERKKTSGFRGGGVRFCRHSCLVLGRAKSAALGIHGFHLLNGCKAAKEDVMFRTLVASTTMALAVLLIGAGNSSVWAQFPFIPEKPEDVIPSKPEDVIPFWPEPDSTQFSGPTRSVFRYTIWNNTNTSVRFRLPSGKVYSLAPGRRGNYKFEGYKPQAKIHVFNTGKTYNLDGGDHKFWWMAGKKQIGFDRDYRID
jgi:hypothetical protein